MQRFILASQSPRRRELLAQIGIRDFDILVPDVDESFDPSLSPQEIVSSICRRKALAARAMAEDESAIILAADTMVFLDGLRLGKPKDPDDAAGMLRALSDRTHEVCTGVTITQGDTIVTRAETTAVTFRALKEHEIAAYIASGDPMDKAGSYGVQGKAALFIRSLRGDYFNVMGLPLHLVGQMLAEFHVELFSEVDAL